MTEQRVRENRRVTSGRWQNSNEILPPVAAFTLTIAGLQGFMGFSDWRNRNTLIDRQYP